MDYRQRTQNPICTGTSVLGIVFDSGVLIAADTLLSYGSMAKFRGVERVIKVNDYTIAGSMGDYADFQQLTSKIEQMQIEQDAAALFDSSDSLSPRALFTWLTRVLYNRRSRFDPLWTTWIVGGIEEVNGQPFLGTVDKIGTAFRDATIATGYGAHMAKPIMRAALEAKNGQPLTEQEARNVISKCMGVLYARDARSWPRYNIAIVKKGADGRVTSEVEKPIDFDIDWTLAQLRT